MFRARQAPEPTKPNLTPHMPPATLTAAGNVHSPCTRRVTASQYRQLLSDCEPSPQGYTEETGNSQVPQGKYTELLAIIEELGKEICPTYMGNKSAMERPKHCIFHTGALVRDCLAELGLNVRS
uniref:Uncharacterized protein n=1 Tax=Prolemur simus TaxID=1328070 RepID=A0A8C9A621_PROSS